MHQVRVLCCMVEFQARRLGGALGAYEPPRSCERSGHAKRAVLGSVCERY